MKKTLLSVGILALVLVGVLLVRPTWLGRGGVSPAQVEAMMAKTDFAPGLAAIQEAFPGEYDVFLQNTADMANAGKDDPNLSARMFDASRAFTSQLRRDNAHYIGAAPVDALRQIQALNGQMLHFLAADPDLCALYAGAGLEGFTQGQALRLDSDLLSQLLAASMRAMAAGRDTPAQHSPPSDADRAELVEGWMDANQLDAEAAQVVFQNRISDPRFCAIATQFQDYMVETKTPAVDRVVVDVSTAMAAQ